MKALKGWQWAEIATLIVVIYTQLALQIFAHQLLAAGLLGLVGLGLVIHAFTWMAPLARKQREEKRQKTQP